MSTCKPFHRSNGWFVLLMIVTLVAITTVRANQEYDYGEYGQDGQEDYYEIDQVHEKVKQPPPKAKTNYYEQLGRLVAHKRAHQMVKAYQAKSGGDVGSPAPPSIAPTADSSTLSTESTTAAASTNATSIATMNETMTATAESTSATVNSSAVNPSTVNSSDVNSSGMSSETPTTSTITVPAASSLASNESTQAEDYNADGGTNHGLLWLLLVLVGVCTCATAANFCPIPKLPGGKGKSTGAGGSSSKGADTEKGTSGEQSKRFCLLSQYTSGHISSGQNTSDKKVTSASQKSTPVTPNLSNKASSSSTGSSISSSSGLPTDSSNKAQNGGGSNGKPATTLTVPSTATGAGATTTPTKH